MPFHNLIEKHIPAQVAQQVNDLFSQIENLLSPHLAVLNEEERKKYGSINEQNKLIVNKVWDFRRTMPDLSAGEVYWAEFELDMQDRHFLELMDQKIQPLLNQIKSAKILHDYDNYQDSQLSSVNILA